MNDSDAHRLPTWRRILARVLTALGVLLLAVTIIAGYLHWQAFDDDTFDETAAELIANEAIRNQIAAASVESLFNNVDVKAELEERLPPDQQRLAGPISAGLRELSERIAVEMLERPRIQALWRESASLAHQELIRILRNETPVVNVQDQAVVLDLRELILRLGERLAFVDNLADRLPDNAGVIRIMDADQLSTAQNLTDFFEAVATWIWVLPLLLWGIAIWLVPGRRRVEVRAIAIGIVVAGLLVLVLRSVAGSYVVDELATTTSVEEAASEAWDIVTELLADGAWAAIAIGIVALIGVWLASPRSSGTSSRRWLAPVFGRPELTYGILALLFLLFVWWGPFAQARRPLFLLVTAILLVIGVEAVRRSTVREFPEEAEAEPREMLRPLGRLRRSKTPAPATPTSSPAVPVEELERLARLHEQGVLSDEELAAAKAKLLA